VAQQRKSTQDSEKDRKLRLLGGIMLAGVAAALAILYVVSILQGGH
jgi:hypothetical protein